MAATATDPESGQTERFRERAPHDDVRKGIQLGDEALVREFRVRLVDEDDRAGRDASRDRADVAERHADARRVVRVRQKHDARVRGDRRQHLVQRKGEFRLRHHLHERPAGHCRIESEYLERRLRHDRFEHGTADGRSQARNRERHDPLVEPIDERYAIGRHSQICGDCVGRCRIRRIEADLIHTQPSERLDHARRTAARVLVLVEPQTVIELRGFLIVTHG